MLLSRSTTLGFDSDILRDRRRRAGMFPHAREPTRRKGRDSRSRVAYGAERVPGPTIRPAWYKP